MNARGWRVLLIGGPSGLGKSTVAERIGTRAGVPACELDEIARSLPECQAFFEFNRWTTPGEALPFALFATACQAVGRVLHTEVPRLIRDNESLIIEGQWIGPETAARLCEDPSVAAVFVLEDDFEETLAGRIGRKRKNARRGIYQPNEWDRVFARFCHEYGRRLRDECTTLRVPFVERRPLETLAERIAEAAALRPSPFTR